ncbi:MAG: glycosyltransferase, partial [Candidatus Binataceae bacterium]
GHRLAIIPSLEDNLPNAVLECLCARIPFLASRSGGIPELIAPEDLEKNTFSPAVPALTACLEQALANGVPIAHPAVDPEENRTRWISWHENLAPAASRAVEIAANESSESKPLVSVCLANRDQPKQLRLSLASLMAQNYRNFEVILVEYGTIKKKAQLELDSIQNEFNIKQGKIIRSDKENLADARDLAAHHAAGEYLLFIDAGGYAKPDLIGAYLNVAAQSGADALTCFLDIFSGDDDPARALKLGPRPFLGAAILPGIFRNQFGDCNVFVRKSAYDAVGGFARQNEPGCGYWGFLARMALGGFQLEVVPRALLSSRARDDALLPGAIEYDDAVSALRPYAEQLPEQLRDLATVMLGLRVRLRQGGSSRPSSPHGGRDPSRLVYELAISGERHLAGMLNGWLEFRSARANLPAGRRQRIAVILRMLVRRHYHRFGHGFGSALRDLSKAPKSDDVETEVRRRSEPTIFLGSGNGASGSVTHPARQDTNHLQPSPR